MDEALRHPNHWKRQAVLQRYIDALDLAVSVGRIQRDASQSGGHFNLTKSLSQRSLLAGAHQRTADAAPLPSRLDEEGANSRRLSGGVEQVRLPAGTVLVASKQCLTPAPAAARHDLTVLLHGKIRAVAD